MNAFLRLCGLGALMAIALSACSSSSCVDNRVYGCLDADEFRRLLDDEIRQQADERTAAYAEDPAIQQQWGLEAIRVPEAYANLDLALGPDTPPGEGVIVGVLDTGIPHLRC